MFTVEVDDTRAQVWLDKLTPKLRSKLEEAITILVEKLRTHIITDKLLGQVLHRRTGRLGQSIQTKVTSTNQSVTGKVYSSSDVPYARIQEYGGKTAAHVIEARRAEALAFVQGGKLVFYKRVNHPGSNIPARSYMRSSLADMREEIIQRLQQAATDGMQP